MRGPAEWDQAWKVLPGPPTQTQGLSQRWWLGVTCPGMQAPHQSQPSRVMFSPSSRGPHFLSWLRGGPLPLTFSTPQEQQVQRYPGPTAPQEATSAHHTCWVHLYPLLPHLICQFLQGCLAPAPCLGPASASPGKREPFVDGAQASPALLGQRGGGGLSCLLLTWPLVP